MKEVDVNEAASGLSRLLEEVQDGREIIIGKSGKPVAKLVPFKCERGDRQLGGWEGKVWMASDFDEADEEVAALFENGKLFPE